MSETPKMTLDEVYAELERRAIKARTLARVLAWSVAPWHEGEACAYEEAAALLHQYILSHAR